MRQGHAATTSSLGSAAMPSDARLDGMVDAHAHSRMGVYLAQCWDRRSYCWYVARSDVRERQIYTILGSVWYLLNPVLSIATYFLVFGVVHEADGGLDGSAQFLAFITIGLFVFQFTQRAVTFGASSIVANTGLIRAIRFPRALLPTSTTLTESITAIPTFLVMFGVVALAGETPTFRWLLVIGIIAWQAVFNLGSSFVAARLTSHFRDTTQILPFVFRLLLYGSGVLFSVDAYIDNDRFRLLFVMNPLYGFISMVRWALMDQPVDAGAVLCTAAWTVVVTIGGFIWFRAAEHEYDRV